MIRQGGAIPHISQDRYPERIVIFDTEAYRSAPVDGVELQTLRLGVACFIDLRGKPEIIPANTLNFTTCEALGGWLEYLTRKDKSLYVYAHNLKYDLQLTGLYTWLVDQGWQASLFVVDDPPTFIKMKRGRMTITFVDTFNYWQYSVEAMGEQLTNRKMIMPDQTAPDQDWFEYCLQDVRVLAQYLIKFIGFLQDNDLAGLGLTLASQAFRSYRYRFMSTDIVLHNNREVTELERAGYFGGRCEAFWIGKPDQAPYYKLDVNSMYPFVMLDRDYPVELVTHTDNLPVGRLARHLERYYCIADVSLDTQKPAYAISNGHKLIFPVGTFRAVLHHVDLQRALKSGEIRAINRIALYEKAAIFKDYVTFFYDRKIKAEIEGDKITRQQSKLFLNSLYGKFGQRQVVSKIVPITEGEKYARMTGYSDSLHRNVEVNYLGNTIELRYKAGEAYYSFPAIAGAVTSYARSYLYDLITTAGFENVFYLDTDSLITNQAGYDNLTPYIDLKRLGALKCEGLSDKLTIHSVKDYEFGNEVKIKGVPKRALKLSDNSWRYDQFRGAKTWVSQGMPPGVEVYSRVKQRRGVYDKGEVLPSGRVVPLRL